MEGLIRTPWFESARTPVQRCGPRKEDPMTSWKCQNCGYTFEADRPPEKCPSCKQTCEFVDNTCYTPDCQYQGMDPRIE